MRFKRSTYEESPCWTLSGSRFWADADWNTRFPFGTSLAAYAGRDARSGPRRSAFTLDLNAPLGEPNRLYLRAGSWSAVLGLPTLRTSRPAGEEISGVPVFRPCLGRPRIAGCGRYRYHPGEDGKWIRNDKPEPLHWGWLTIERNRSDS